jgi:predicted DNA-binding transcriptional regulator AlpA
MVVHMEHREMQAANSSPTPDVLQAEERLKLEQVSRLTGWGRSKIYGEVKAGRFPQPERRGIRCTRWRAGDVLAWLQSSRGAA